MTIDANLDTFMGKAVKRFEPDMQQLDTENVCYKLMVDYDDDVAFDQKLAALANHPQAHTLTALVIGMWNDDAGVSVAEVITQLVAAKTALSQLRGLFLGDITYEECEISWIVQDDISPLYAAYPQLDVLGIRGSDGLRLGDLRHANLRALTIESGGLNETAIQQVCQAHLPKLEHLELWLGSENYGWNGQLDDLQPILSGELFPQLRYLGLRDCERADELAALVATAPVVEKIETLDLSLGNLGDAGASALLQLPTGKNLKTLNIQHHYVSPAMQQKLAALPLMLIAGEAEPDDDDDEPRYIAVSE